MFSYLFYHKCSRLLYAVNDCVDLGFFVGDIVFKFRMAAFETDRAEHTARRTDPAADTAVRIDPGDAAAQTAVLAELPGTERDALHVERPKVPRIARSTGIT